MQPECGDLKRSPGVLCAVKVKPHWFHQGLEGAGQRGVCLWEGKGHGPYILEEITVPQQKSQKSKTSDPAIEKSKLGFYLFFAEFAKFSSRYKIKAK